MPDLNRSRYKDVLTTDEIEKLNRIRESKILELRHRGMRLFNIHGVDVYALNEKNAIRKVNNLLNQTL